MQLSPRFVLVLIIAAAGVVFVTTLARATIYAPDSEVASTTLAALAPARTAEPGELPQRLRIPALSINAFVRHVGINADGDMATPGNFTDVGWYKYGTVPGFVGSAVMDGHVDNGLSRNGVFKHLSELKAGEDIYVDTASSSVLHYIVREVVSYPTDQVPAERIFTAKDSARLNLITCDGVWVKDAKDYDRRLVVYAELVP